MTLVEKLEKRARELESVWGKRGYNQRIADDRELLEQAASTIRELERRPALTLFTTVGPLVDDCRRND